MRSSMLKGVVDLLVLATVSRGESYGYAIVQQLQELGWVDASEATVYGTLRRLDKEGALESHRELTAEGRARRYYRLSEAGADALHQLRSEWCDLSAIVSRAVRSGSGKGEA